MTHYDILGISRTAKDADIKKAYHQMIIAFHPDKYQGDKQFAAKKTHEIIEAYKVLHNPASRKSYDALLNSQERSTAVKPNNTPPSAAGYESRRYDTNTSSHSQPTGVPKYKLAFGVLGMLFVIFVVALFITIIINI